MDLDTNQWISTEKKKFSNINSILFYSFKHLHYSAFTTYFGIKIFVSKRSQKFAINECHAKSEHPVYDSIQSVNI